MRPVARDDAIPTTGKRKMDALEAAKKQFPKGAKERSASR
jgi:hypothetical protein